MTREEKILYLAGFFDGEGCVRVHCNRAVQKYGAVSPCHRLVLIVNQRADHSEPLLMLKEVFGGWLGKGSSRKGCRPIASWQIHGKHAFAALKLMLPYLTVKRAAALAGIAFMTWKEMILLCRKPSERLSSFEVETNDNFMKIFGVINGNKPFDGTVQ